MGGASGYIMWAFAKAPHISSPSATTTRSLLYETRSLRRWTSHRSRSRTHFARPTSRFSAARCTCSSWSTDSLPLSCDSLIRELLYKSKFLCVVAKATPFLSLMQGCECVSCLGAAHSETALTGTECYYCGDMSLSSLHSRLTFLSESNPAPRALPLFSSQGPRKKQRGRGSQRSEMS